MTSDVQVKLTELLERVKAATGPDRELDLALATALVPDILVLRQRDDDSGSDPYTYWEYTGKIDDAIALVERLLPVNSTRLVSDPSGCSCAVTWWPDGLSGGRRVQANEAQQSLPLAILAALLTALSSIETGGK